MNAKSLLCACALLPLLSACGGRQQQPEADLPDWLEPDSAQAIKSRLLSDFSLTFEEGVEQIIADHPELTIDSVRAFADRHYVEVMEIDGVLRMHRKSPRNLNLLHPAYNGGWRARGYNASPARHAVADSVIRWSKGLLADGAAKQMRVRFSIDVPGDSALIGDTLRVWMPYPMVTDRQSGVRLVSCEPATGLVSSPERSAHSSIYFTAPAPAPGDTAHFEYVAEYVAHGAYFSPEVIARDIKPYDTDGELYKKYTAFDNRHIIRLDSLARAIVGGETDPYRQSELVYDYIINRYPWAGAREYSTIECLPQYVIDQGHGDCGQVSLLYISLMRSLGVPARWESGWMTHPGELNLHDWAEVYYEGIGWVPVDVSFGRYTNSADPAIEHFYSTGIDTYRFVANKTVGGAFDPPKRYVRSETVDAQLGEVECGKGNMFYPAWSRHFEVLSCKPIAK